MLSDLFKPAMLASAMSLPLVGLAASQALADKSNFHVYNSSSRDVYYLYISESSLADWQNDVLGENVLSSGGDFQVFFGNSNPGVCMYDFRAELDDGSVVENFQVDVCNNDYFEVFDQ